MTGDAPPVAVGRYRAQLVWGAAVTVYAVAVLHRSSFGVAGIEAVDRFGLSATVLSTFAMVQLGVYAALQIPAGMLIDRFGSRALITTGATLMATGQLVLGVADTLPLAYAARVLIGAGDATTFVSVIRLVAAWFSPRQAPVFTQLTGMLGQLGQVAAAVPLVAVLHVTGWTSAFVGLGAVGALAAVMSWATVRDAPPGARAVRSRTSLLGPLREAVRVPGTWLGFWSHAASQFSMVVFVMLWGYPFLVSAQGLTPGEAGALMSLNVLATIASGPLIGVYTGRHPLRRSWMVLAIAVMTASVWVAVLLQPEPSPMWLLALLVVVLGVGGPASVIGFDFARTFNTAGRLGTATGLVNVGGFTLAFLSVFAIGVVLDLATAPGDAPLSLPAFRVAFSVMAVPWTVAVIGVLVTRRTTRRAMLADGVRVPPVRDVLARRRETRAGSPQG